MTASPKEPAFEDFLFPPLAEAGEDVFSPRSSLLEAGAEGIEKACAGRPEIFAKPCNLPADRLNELYGTPARTKNAAANDGAPLSGELALRLHQADTLSPDELRRLRRDLALWHHPDRHAAELRDVTSDVMKGVNAMIDAALRKQRGN